MIPSIAEIDEAEHQHLAVTGEPGLGGSLALLKQRWAAGYRDRDTALRLMFLCWYENIEPPFLTGMDNDPDCQTLCLEAFHAVGGVEATDPETCFVIGCMVELGAWCFGEHDYWERVGPALRSRAADLSPERFVGRGSYKAYFRHMLVERSPRPSTSHEGG